MLSHARGQAAPCTKRLHSVNAHMWHTCDDEAVAISRWCLSLCSVCVCVVTNGTDAFEGFVGGGGGVGGVPLGVGVVVVSRWRRHSAAQHCNAWLCVCVRPEHGWCVVGWWALCHHHQRQHHAVDGVCGNDGATQPSGVTPTHRRVCGCGRVCCGVCAWWCRFGKCVLLSTTVTWCALMPLGGCTTTAAAFCCCWCFFVSRAFWASCTTRVFVC